MPLAALDRAQDRNESAKPIARRGRLETTRPNRSLGSAAWTFVAGN
jgi:hypothetical protein